MRGHLALRLVRDVDPTSIVAEACLPANRVTEVNPITPGRYRQVGEVKIEPGPLKSGNRGIRGSDVLSLDPKPQCHCIERFTALVRDDQCRVLDRLPGIIAQPTLQLCASRKGHGLGTQKLPINRFNIAQCLSTLRLARRFRCRRRHRRSRGAAGIRLLACRKKQKTRHQENMIFHDKPLRLTACDRRGYAVAKVITSMPSTSAWPASFQGARRNDR